MKWNEYSNKIVFRNQEFLLNANSGFESLQRRRYMFFENEKNGNNRKKACNFSKQVNSKARPV